MHRATLHDGRAVAVKVQYPGVADSIESDVDNLLRLVSLANVLPKGLYVEAAAAVAKRELALECDYRRVLLPAAPWLPAAAGCCRCFASLFAAAARGFEGIVILGRGQGV